jgi:hypothetical protein
VVEFQQFAARAGFSRDGRTLTYPNGQVQLPQRPESRWPGAVFVGDTVNEQAPRIGSEGKVPVVFEIYISDTFCWIDT